MVAALTMISCGDTIPFEEELFASAREHETTGDYNRAIEAYDTVIDKYPDSANRYKAIFMKAYIYTDVLKDTVKALEAFDTLLSQYPECDLADDALILREIARKGEDLMSVFQDSVSSE
jgi:outer membrane protein assembly factor BamD (BamD/ComL family)